MNHYKNLATLAFRVIGIIVTAYSLVAWVYILFTSRYSERGTLAAATFADLAYLIFGVLMIALSKQLASLAVKGLDE